MVFHAQCTCMYFCPLKCGDPLLGSYRVSRSPHESGEHATFDNIKQYALVMDRSYIDDVWV